MSTQEFFAELDGGARQSVAESHFVPLDLVFGRLLGRLDGEDSRVTTVAALPAGLTLDSAAGERYEPPLALVAEGAADALVVRLVHRGTAGARTTETVGRRAPDTDRPVVAVAGADGGPVYAEEVWTADDAVDLFTYFVRHGETLPVTVHLR